MKIKAITRFVRISPEKIVMIARVIRGRSANEALECLSFISTKGARLLAKTLKSAIANAENNHSLSSDTLFISKSLIKKGPIFKRWNAGARGSPHPIKKRTSHIHIELSESSIN